MAGLWQGSMKPKTSPWRPAAWLLLAVSLLLVSGCAPGCQPRREPGVVLEEVPAQDWPLLGDDLDLASLEQAGRASLTYLRRLPPEREFAFGPRRVSAARMIQAVQRFQAVMRAFQDPAARTQALKRYFVLLRSVGSDGRGRVLFTGYYEPVLPARRQPQPPFVYPLYPMPPDMVFIDLRRFDPRLPARRLVGRVQGRKVLPYHDREAIDFQGVLEGKVKPLAYLADPVEAFFLHIQGSGQVVFPDGSRLRLGYAASNGRPYRSIGRYLIDQGLMDLEGMSMQAIKRFLDQHPELRRRVLAHNPSYVFFRPLPAQGGPLGAYSQPLTAGRSIATDRRIFPGMALAWIHGTRPALAGGEVPLARFVFNQDTGGAIRGPGRVDLFFGSGDEAGELAGRMKHVGQLYFLAPRP